MALRLCDERHESPVEESSFRDSNEIRRKRSDHHATVIRPDFSSLLDLIVAGEIQSTNITSRTFVQYSQQYM